MRGAVEDYDNPPAMADPRAKVILFEDLFEVEAVNPDGKKFDKVTRLVCKPEMYEVVLKIDIATDVYPMKRGDKFNLALVSTLRLDGKPDDGTYQHNEGEPSLLDEYEYGMHGRVFKYEHHKGAMV